MRTSGTDLGWHAAVRFGPDDARIDVVSRFFDDGLRAGQRIAYIGLDGVDLGRRSLEVGGHDPDELEETGRFVSADARQAYLPGGRFDVADRLRDYRALVAEALHDGFSGFRVAAEVPEELTDVPAPWASYEARADALAGAEPFSALCIYDGRIWDERSFGLIDALHGDTVSATGRNDRVVHVRARSGKLEIGGEIDAGNADAIRDPILSAVPDLRDPVIDLHELRFSDAAGTRMIADVAQEVERSFGRVEIRRAPRMFARVWNLMDLGVAAPGIRIEES